MKTSRPEIKDTVCVPKTDFSMRAKLQTLEPNLLERWQEIDLWSQIRAQSVGRKKFILHDGPPYANGNLHLGHALNKILKDIINRQFQKLGFDANYVPGWDCHGLPIEWKIEEQYRKQNQDKDSVPINEFRAECRRFAAHWMGIQKEEFIRLGVFGDWDEPYSTMTYAAEATIVHEIGKFLSNDYLIRRDRPVMWSVVEQTALADAEIEYEEIKSPSITVRFAMAECKSDDLQEASVLIWTTTPWTIPCNRAICIHPKLRYALLEVVSLLEGSLAKVGEKLIVAASCVEQVKAMCKIDESHIIREISAEELEGCITTHPLAAEGFDHPVPILHAEYVSDEQGTGCVHTAPGHGPDDYQSCQKHGIETPLTVMADGYYHESVPLMAGHQVITNEGAFGSANGVMIKHLLSAEGLISKGSIRHQYPHSWRSKKPIIYRSTPQWFISMSHEDLRARVLSEIDKVEFTPSMGKNRLRSLIEARPDWCISRQRAWGVPIAIFVEKKSGEPLKDPKVMQRIVDAFSAEGADCWYDSPPSRFLGDGYNPDDYEQIFDVVDVWFDSGSTHAFVLEAREDLESPATLYLEGSDQHRGFFHSSILQSTGTRNRAPYKGVLTHGFALDGKGQKMSKSLGNIISPQEINEKYGAEILRLWVATLDYGNDVRISDEILKGVVDIYRRFRNTLRWLMGNLHYFQADRKVIHENLPLAEQIILHRLFEVDQSLRSSALKYDIQNTVRELFQFCNQDLSALYFDIRKDVLYCDAKDDHKRLSSLTVTAVLFDLLTVWLSPIMSFTTEEAWLQQTGDEDANSVHLRDFPAVPEEWHQPELALRWNLLMQVRKVILGALEVERKAGNLKSALEASPLVYIQQDELWEAVQGIDMAELCITSDIEITQDAPNEEAFRLEDVRGVAVLVKPAEGIKCDRCWKFTKNHSDLDDGSLVCKRCIGVLKRDHGF